MCPALPPSPQQHGFHCDRSTETAASCLVDYVEHHIYSWSHCLTAFLDVRSAFDSVTPQHIQRSLLRVGADPGVIGWYNDYLLHRNMTYHHGHLTTTRTTGMGFPQGGVCSASFLSLAFDKAVLLINTDDNLGVAFADDCAFLSGGTDPALIISHIQCTVDRPVEWGSECGLTFNPAKTQVLFFSRSRTMPPWAITVAGYPIPYSTTAQYLGLTLDRRLWWHDHVHQKTSKAK